MLSDSTISTIGKYVIAAGIVAICGYIIATTADATNLTQAWSAIFLVVGWIVRDAAGTSATTNAIKIQEATVASQPVYEAPLTTDRTAGGNPV